MGGAKSVDVVRLFGIFEKWKVGKKREDFSIDPCYTGSVESGGNGITNYKLVGCGREIKGSLV